METLLNKKPGRNTVFFNKSELKICSSRKNFIHLHPYLEKPLTIKSWTH